MQWGVKLEQADNSNEICIIWRCSAVHIPFTREARVTLLGNHGLQNIMYDNGIRNYSTIASASLDSLYKYRGLFAADAMCMENLLGCIIKKLHGFVPLALKQNYTSTARWNFNTIQVLHISLKHMKYAFWFFLKNCIFSLMIGNIRQR